MEFGIPYTEEEKEALRHCELCPRKCGVNRLEGERGFCNCGCGLEIALVCNHKGEEPILSGEKGVCNIFFSHCNLQCVYCQNKQISSNNNSVFHPFKTFDELIEKIKAQGIKGIESIEGAGMNDGCDTLTIKTLYGDKTCSYNDAMLERCHVCKGKEHKVSDEIFFESAETDDGDRFAGVDYIESLSPEEKFEFFKKELSKCIRCNACRNVCPACSCRKCVFDSTKFDADRKANVDPFEESMFHIIRAFHVAGRCTDCGECSRVCPQGIPLHLFNRKFIKDINEFYGEYQAGAEVDERSPLTNFTFDDVEPSIVGERG